MAGVQLTHPDRVLYPGAHLTKQDVADYVARVAERMLPHVAGRPLSLYRCPEGIGNDCFFQKHWVGSRPAAVDTVRIKEKSGSGEYLVIHDADGLRALVQFDVLEVHTWSVRTDDIESPDRIVFDLDPAPGVAWAAVREAAESVRSALRKAGLTSWAKLTGGKGIHVVAPIERRVGWDDISDFAHDIADDMEARDGKRYIAKASKSARRGKIFIDWLRNTRGATWVAPWSMRARPNAPISIPLSWPDLRKAKAANAFTLSGLASGRLPGDPWAHLPDKRQRLPTGEH
jgi:bifunctional non-homologous end joining protein LigD